MSAIFVALTLLVAVVLVQAAQRALRRWQMLEDVRRLRRMEERLGKNHPEVQDLRVRIWRFMLHGDDAFRHRL